MENNRFVVQSNTLFSESLLWQLNRDYYQKAGITAWSEEVVPHHMTSNAMVGKTYAELIFAFLQDRAAKGATTEKVYILELGAGHGRLAFHIIKHLEQLKKQYSTVLPPYCYILSDIVEDNLNFFHQHPQFQNYLEQGLLDVAYFDAVKSEDIQLRYSGLHLQAQSLSQPLIVIANYFFDSLPIDLFMIKDKLLSVCSIALESEKDPKDQQAAMLLENIELVYQKVPVQQPFYSEPLFNEILQDYQKQLSNTHLLFPQLGMQCLAQLQKLSKEGIMLLSMDKGLHELHDLEKKKEPEVINHGSISLWVNYHAIGAYCEKIGGKVLYPSNSSFHLQIGCLLFLKAGESYEATNATYQRVVDDFGPDDYNSMKLMIFQNISRLRIVDLLALIRLNAYDSTFFIKVIPRLKQVTKQLTFSERRRFGQALHQVWNIYFNIDEALDLAYEIGGFFYDLGFYQEALDYFQHSVDAYGHKADIYYNSVLCYYELRKDQLFTKTLKEAKAAFPDYTHFEQLERLDLGAV